MTDPATNLTNDDVIAIKVRVETAIYATSEALKAASVDPRSPGRTMHNRLAEALSILRSTLAHCDRILFDLVDDVPTALRLEVERDTRNAIAQGKIWGEVFDSLFTPKR